MIKPTENKKTALVLEGGAMRGIFTAGVVDYLMENGITFPACTGVSAGAAFGCNVKSNQPGRVLRYNLRFARDPRYCSFRSLLWTGDLFNAQFCYHEVPEQLDPFDVEAFDNSPVVFTIVCSDVETGKPYYKQLDKGGYDCYEWIRASASMPLFANVVEMEGGKYLDGGVTDSIPLRFSERTYARNIVVLTRPRDYVKAPASKLWLYKLRLGRYPNMIKAIQNRYLMYQEQREHVFAQEKAGKALVICPDAPLDIGRVEHDPARIQETYDRGRKIAAARLDEIRRFIANDH